MKPRCRIFFGIFIGLEGCWHNVSDDYELPEFLEDEDEFEKHVLKVLDCPPEPEGDAVIDAWSKWWDAKTELLKQCPLRYVSSGASSAGSPDTSLAMRWAYIRTDWNDNPFDLTDSPIMHMTDAKHMAWTQLMQEWCKKLGIPWDKVEAANPEGPRWICNTGD